jgi:hypothetical protein
VKVESVEEGEKMRAMQAPNRKDVWSRSQRPREQAMVGPRFEQMTMDDQVCSKLRAQASSSKSRLTLAPTTPSHSGGASLIRNVV